MLYRDVSDADKTADVVWLGANVIEPDQAVWALRITPETDIRINIGAGANVWISHRNARSIASEGAGAV
jgi:hypothetical protein